MQHYNNNFIKKGVFPVWLRANKKNAIQTSLRFFIIYHGTIHKAQNGRAWTINKIERVIHNSGAFVTIVSVGF